MIRRDVGAAQWRRKQYGPNVAALELTTKRGKLSIINVYNPKIRSPRLGEWPRIAEALGEAQGEVLLLGDFNTHHSKWGGRGIACEQSAQHLLYEAVRWELELLTPKGEATWRRGTQKSVIDLTFASQELRERVEFCGPEERWALPQDHIPIRIKLDVRQAPDAQEESKRYALDKLDKERLIEALRQTGWQQAPCPINALQQALEQLLPKLCPKSRPCKRVRIDWSPQASEFLAGARRARRRHTASQLLEDRQEYKRLSNCLKREMRKTAKANWRRLIEELTNDQKLPHNKGLWRLSRWSRRVAGKPHADPHIPALRRHEGEASTEKDEERAKILAEKFFPPTPQVHRRRHASETQARSPVPVEKKVTQEEMAAIIRALPTGKASGPDRIPNEILKILVEEISEGLAQGVSMLLAAGTLPKSLKESTTIALRKEGKKDYSLPSSYRPIALENTLAKVVEKVLANRLSDAAEKHALLPWAQMGARKERSTLSAIGLLTSCVQTAWRAKPGCVVSMLSLDLAGAFDNVPPERLTEILQKKGLPAWLVQVVASFTQGRRTRIAYTGYQSEWLDTATGIPQGSPLSPILFLFFISELLERFQQPGDKIIGFGFVDDTNLVTWGSTAKENCRKLTAAHQQCEEWARENGAKFEPSKYQLIHFTRRRRHAREDLASSVQIGTHQVVPQEKEIRVLGVWLDPALTWKEHIAQATRKGNAASEALSRLATSTWGPTARNTRLLYTAVVRPTLLYGSQEWSMRPDGKPLAKTTMAPIHLTQNACLRKLTGGYIRTPRAALERESDIMPIDLYATVGRYQRASKTRVHQVETKISDTADAVWRSMRGAGTTRDRPLTNREKTAARADEIAREARTNAEEEREGRARASGARPLRPRPPTSKAKLINDWGRAEWRTRWERAKQRIPGQYRATTWLAPWTQDTRLLYDGLTKAEATALFLMRTEVIGLNAWLAAVRVPGVFPACPCGWHAQTVRHVLLHCIRHERIDLLRKCGSGRLEDILQRPSSAKHAARWLVRSGVMEQFKLAAEIAEEDTREYQAFPEVEWW